ncbi:MAG: DNA replication and repair protein RecF [Actinomycetota bacterium]|nr:DNA replication and repair protein RecF [Actinomycetota bacterium]
MGLTVTRLTLSDFRNYEYKRLGLSGNLTILVGPNATGKTSMIEALQLLTSGRSFRKPATIDLVRRGAAEARVTLEASQGSRRAETELRVTADGVRSYLLNGKSVRGRREIAGTLPSVVFTPDDISVVKGPSDGRRATVDTLGEQLSRTYGALRREYERALRHRNALLKEGRSSASLEVWSETLADLGASLSHHRARLLERVESVARGVYETVSSGEELSVRYEMPWLPPGQGNSDKKAVKEALLGELRRRAEEEVRRGMTLSGPHRDDIVFQVDGSEARAFASQGQQRSIVLAWKIAEVSVIEEVTGETPLLLLDDVMSELDGSRREALAALVGGHTQTVVTTANLQYFSSELLESAEVVMLP